jgi:hypothetical protein
MIESRAGQTPDMKIEDARAKGSRLGYCLPVGSGLAVLKPAHKYRVGNEMPAILISES